MVAVEIDPVLAGELCRRPSRAARRRTPTGSRSCTADALQADRDLPGPPPPRWSPTCPTTSRCRCCCTCWPALPSLERALVMVQAEVADRLAAPPGSQGLRRAVGEGRVVRRRTPRRRRRAHASSGRRRTSTRGLVAMTRRRAAGHGGDRARRSSPSSTRPSRSAARRCAPRWPAGPARRPPPSRRCAPPASIRRLAARRSTSTTFARLAAHRPRRQSPRVASMSSVTVRAPAKINLQPVGRRRRAATATTTWPPSTTPCRCTTR